MLLISQVDLELFFNENYLTFLILGGLLVVMFSYRDVPLPAAGNFLLIIIVLFIMSVANGLETWAKVSPDRIQVRIVTSVIHYILQPFVIYLELLTIIPRGDIKEQVYGGGTKMPRRFLPDQKTLLLLSLPIIFNTAIYLLAPFTRDLVFHFNEDYSFNRGILGYTIYIVTFFYLFLLLIWSFYFLKEKDRRMGITLFFIVGIAVLTGIFEALNIISGYIDEVFALGVLLYYMYLTTVHEREMQASLSLRETELARRRLQLLTEQIQPHFLFNSLHIIKSLIRTDQKKAMASVEYFSDYLRANLNAISSDDPIPFEMELANVKAYISLVQNDERRQITVEYDIKEKDFNIPPLTVEPIVENAVLHGVRKGGNIRLASYKDHDCITITVTDNGKGINPSQKKRKKSRHGIGLNNVRTRLALFCDGSLEMNSKDGTTVTIRLPVNTEDSSHSSNSGISE
jgi:sensor histidine kinase YesM